MCANVLRRGCIMNMLELIGADEAARRLGVSRTTVYRLVERGEIVELGYLGRRRALVLDAGEVERARRRRARDVR